jgi:hypothetical protein
VIYSATASAIFGIRSGDTVTPYSLATCERMSALSCPAQTTTAPAHWTPTAGGHPSGRPGARNRRPGPAAPTSTAPISVSTVLPPLPLREFPLQSPRHDRDRLSAPTGPWALLISGSSRLTVSG